MICELMYFSIHCVGISVRPSDCMSRILILQGMLFKLVKSLLMMSAKD
jgi:hypothetical protein